MTALLDMWSTGASLVLRLKSPGTCLEDRHFLCVVNNNPVKSQLYSVINLTGNYPGPAVKVVGKGRSYKGEEWKSGLGSGSWEFNGLNNT